MTVCGGVRSARLPRCPVVWAPSTDPLVGHVCPPVDGAQPERQMQPMTFQLYDETEEGKHPLSGLGRAACLLMAGSVFATALPFNALTTSANAAPRVPQGAMRRGPLLSLHASKGPAIWHPGSRWAPPFSYWPPVSSGLLPDPMVPGTTVPTPVNVVGTAPQGTVPVNASGEPNVQPPAPPPAAPVTAPAPATPAPSPAPVRRAPEVPAPAPSSDTMPNASTFACIRRHESHDNYQDDTGNGYYGAYQFSLSTWRSVGGEGLPSDASPAEQDRRAVMLEQRDGWSQWSTARRCGV